MRIVAFQIGYPPRARVGSWLSMHEYYAGLVAAGHKVIVLTKDNVPSYELDGVRVMFLGGNLWPELQRAKVAISIHGDSSGLHQSAIEERKPSIRFIHGTHDTLFHKLLRGGRPTLVVFNSHTLAEAVRYDGEYMVCHPWVNPAKFETTPGDHITLVNLIKPKGLDTFDMLARHLRDRKFLGVAGGYGDQELIARKNITLIPQTGNVRDDVLARTRILLMPSDHETWGMIGVEAMCAGIPVIAHPTPGLRESLGTAGLFADRDDVDAWIDIIEDLDNKAKYNDQSRKAKQRAHDLATDDSVVRFVKRVEEFG